MDFKLRASFGVSKVQDNTISQLIKWINQGDREQILLWATWTWKTFIMANIIERINKPTLVLAHNKTLAAQLCSEFQNFFPENSVCYFVSYYDYYQPEAYIAKTDTYIEKETSINEEIDKYRHSATQNLLNRKDVIIVASVSAIYGIGDVLAYEKSAFEIKAGKNIVRDDLLRKLVDMQYYRSIWTFKQGQFNVLWDTVEIFPPSGDSVYRLEFWWDEVDKIDEVDWFTGEIIAEHDSVKIYPSKHNVTDKAVIERAVPLIRTELQERVEYFKSVSNFAAAERIKSRTEYDIEMLKETWYCNWIENYVRYLNELKPGQSSATLLEFFPKDYLMFIDESHITVPQIWAMFEGNLSRKQSLVLHGFRLPSCLDNRPLKFDEFDSKINQVVFVSATPWKYEYRLPEPIVVEQVIRPTWLLDPEIEIRPKKWEMDDLLYEIGERIKAKERVLVTTVTKAFAEELSEFFIKAWIKAKYLHSEIQTFERVDILRDLRIWNIDVIVGINLLREWLDLPEVSLIAILDADKQWFLRSRDALIQVIWRAARNANGRVIMYADRVTQAMQEAIDETNRRRAIQHAYNIEHGIVPKTVIKDIKDISRERDLQAVKKKSTKVKRDKIKDFISELENKMFIAIESLDFEAAAEYRDEIEVLREQL